MATRQHEPFFAAHFWQSPNVGENAPAENEHDETNANDVTATTQRTSGRIGGASSSPLLPPTSSYSSPLPFCAASVLPPLTFGRSQTKISSGHTTFFGTATATPFAEPSRLLPLHQLAAFMTKEAQTAERRRRREEEKLSRIRRERRRSMGSLAAVVGGAGVGEEEKKGAEAKRSGGGSGDGNMAEKGNNTDAAGIAGGDDDAMTKRSENQSRPALPRLVPAPISSSSSSALLVAPPFGTSESFDFSCPTHVLEALHALLSCDRPSALQVSVDDAFAFTTHQGKDKDIANKNKDNKSAPSTTDKKRGGGASPAAAAATTARHCVRIPVKTLDPLVPLSAQIGVGVGVGGGASAVAGGGSSSVRGKSAQRNGGGGAAGGKRQQQGSNPPPKKGAVGGSSSGGRGGNAVSDVGAAASSSSPSLSPAMAELFAGQEARAASLLPRLLMVSEGEGQGRDGEGSTPFISPWTRGGGRGGNSSSPLLSPRALLPGPSSGSPQRPPHNTTAARGNTNTNATTITASAAASLSTPPPTQQPITASTPPPPTPHTTTLSVPLSLSAYLNRSTIATAWAHYVMLSDQLTLGDGSTGLGGAAGGGGVRAVGGLLYRMLEVDLGRLRSLPRRALELKAEEEERERARQRDRVALLGSLTAAQHHKNLLEESERARRQRAKEQQQRQQNGLKPSSVQRASSASGGGGGVDDGTTTKKGKGTLAAVGGGGSGGGEPRSRSAMPIGGGGTGRYAGNNHTAVAADDSQGKTKAAMITVGHVVKRIVVADDAADGDTCKVITVIHLVPPPPPPSASLSDVATEGLAAPTLPPPQGAQRQQQQQQQSKGQQQQRPTGKIPLGQQPQKHQQQPAASAAATPTIDASHSSSLLYAPHIVLNPHPQPLSETSVAAARLRAEQEVAEVLRRMREEEAAARKERRMQKKNPRRSHNSQQRGGEGGEGEKVPTRGGDRRGRGGGDKERSPPPAAVRSPTHFSLTSVGNLAVSVFSGDNALMEGGDGDGGVLPMLGTPTSTPPPPPAQNAPSPSPLSILPDSSTPLTIDGTVLPPSFALLGECIVVVCEILKSTTPPPPPSGPTSGGGGGDDDDDEGGKKSKKKRSRSHNNHDEHRAENNTTAAAADTVVSSPLPLPGFDDDAAAVETTAQTQLTKEEGEKKDGRLLEEDPTVFDGYNVFRNPFNNKGVSTTTALGGLEGSSSSSSRTQHNRQSSSSNNKTTTNKTISEHDSHTVAYRQIACLSVRDVAEVAIAGGAWPAVTVIPTGVKGGNALNAAAIDALSMTTSCSDADISYSSSTLSPAARQRLLASLAPATATGGGGGNGRRKSATVTATATVVESLPTSAFAEPSPFISYSFPSHVSAAAAAAANEGGGGLGSSGEKRSMSFSSPLGHRAGVGVRGVDRRRSSSSSSALFSRGAGGQPRALLNSVEQKSLWKNWQIESNRIRSLLSQPMILPMMDVATTAPSSPSPSPFLSSHKAAAISGGGNSGRVVDIIHCSSSVAAPLSTFVSEASGGGAGRKVSRFKNEDGQANGGAGGVGVGTADEKEDAVDCSDLANPSLTTAGLPMPEPSIAIPTATQIFAADAADRYQQQNLANTSIAEEIGLLEKAKAQLYAKGKKLSAPAAERLEKLTVERDLKYVSDLQEIFSTELRENLGGDGGQFARSRSSRRRRGSRSGGAVSVGSVLGSSGANIGVDPADPTTLPSFSFLRRPPSVLLRDGIDGTITDAERREALADLASQRRTLEQRMAALARARGVGIAKEEDEDEQGGGDDTKATERAAQAKNTGITSFFSSSPSPSHQNRQWVMRVSIRRDDTIAVPPLPDALFNPMAAASASPVATAGSMLSTTATMNKKEGTQQRRRQSVATSGAANRSVQSLVRRSPTPNGGGSPFSASLNSPLPASTTKPFFLSSPLSPSLLTADSSAMVMPATTTNNAHAVLLAPNPRLVNNAAFALLKRTRPSPSNELPSGFNTMTAEDGRNRQNAVAATTVDNGGCGDDAANRLLHTMVVSNAFAKRREALLAKKGASNLPRAATLSSQSASATSPKRGAGAAAASPLNSTEIDFSSDANNSNANKQRGGVSSAAASPPLLLKKQASGLNTSNNDNNNTSMPPLGRKKSSRRRGRTTSPEAVSTRHHQHQPFELLSSASFDDDDGGEGGGATGGQPLPSVAELLGLRDADGDAVPFSSPPAPTPLPPPPAAMYLELVIVSADGRRREGRIDLYLQ